MTGIMMTYKPSPKPNFFKPTHIKYNSMDTYIWGDEEAGNVKDWIYVSNENLHQIIFGMKPGGNFKHSDQYRTIYGADELLYVLSGVLIINNPKTGETQKINKGESVFFHKDTWHHAFNFSNEYLQVLEFFSPPPITGTSGVYGKKQELLKKSIYNRDKEFTIDKSFINQKSFKIITENDYIWSIEGPNQETLIGTLIKTKYLEVKMITLNAFKKSHIFKFNKNTSYLSLDNKLKIKLSNVKDEFHLQKKDGLYLPSLTEFTIENLNDRDAKIIVCVGI
ncbi:cupin domain-containing protein [bacterium]|nr:cupin domain-containing protein [bacterium]